MSSKRLFFLYTTLIASVVSTAQDYYVVQYKNGDSRVEQISNIKEITLLNDGSTPFEKGQKEISRGLQAYYTFDNATCNDMQGTYHGSSNGGTFIDDTPNQSGKALLLKNAEYIVIPAAPLDGRANFSVSVWVKDFGNSLVMKSTDGSYFFGGTIRITEDQKVTYYTNKSNSGTPKVTFASQLSSMQSGQWIMLTIVTEQIDTYNATSTLFINGRKADSNSSNISVNNGAHSMMLGGRTETKATSQWSDPMKIDNVRLYSVALTEDEVAEIYARERRPAPITLSSSALTFNKDESKQTFVIKNNTSLPTNFTLSDDLEVIKCTPASGYLEPNGTSTVEVNVPNRDEVSTFRRGTIVVVANGARYAVNTEIDPGKNAQTGQIAVRRGLQAYYTFDNSTVDDNYQDYYPGQNNGGTFINDTPNGTGKALLLRQKQYVSIGYTPLDGKKSFSVSLWVKDFGTVCPIKSVGSNLFGPSIIIQENQRITYYTNKGNSGTPSVEFQTDFAPYQNGLWTMITIVTEQFETYNATSTLYINGRRADVQESSISVTSGATSMILGGQLGTQSNSAWSDPMKLDNVRIYGVALSDEEVAEIYASEIK